MKFVYYCDKCAWKNNCIRYRNLERAIAILKRSETPEPYTGRTTPTYDRLNMGNEGFDLLTFVLECNQFRQNHTEK